MLAYLEWEAKTWDQRAEDSMEALTPEGNGCAAYAAGQATVRHSLAAQFATLWQTVPVPTPRPATKGTEEEEEESLILDDDEMEEEDEEDEDSDVDI